MQVILIAFGVLLAIQLVYLVAFLAAFSRKTESKQMDQPPVSIIVCAHDEEQNLHELIPALLGQQYPVFEVIIVNDRSNDNTFDYLLAETAKDHRLRMVHVNRLPEEFNSKKYALTLGIKAATYDWILLTDADCRPVSSTWIYSMSRFFQDSTQFVLGFSPYQKKKGFLNMFIRFEALLTFVQYMAFALLRNPYMGVGRNLAYRKSSFLENKGFNNFIKVTGGDDDLYVNQHAKGKNTQVCLQRDATVYSVPQSTWRSFFRQKVRHLSAGKRYKFGHRLLLGIFTLSWILTWFVGIALLFFPETMWWAAGGLVLRTVFLAIVFHDAIRRVGEKFGLWVLPFLDFLYSIYYISTGLAALLTKKIRWKN